MLLQNNALERDLHLASRVSPWERGRPARILVKALLQRQSAGEPTNPVKPIATTLPGLVRAGRPRSQAMPPRRCGGGCLAGDFSESRRAPFGKLPFARESSPRPHDGADHSRVKQVLFQVGRDGGLPGLGQTG